MELSLCNQTVTVFHNDGSVHRRVVENCFLQYTDCLSGDGQHFERKFFFLQPGNEGLSPGDKIVPGEVPNISNWNSIYPENTPGLCIVREVEHYPLDGTEGFYIARG